MAFPTTPLRLTAELALGADLTADPSTWSWTDVTALVLGPEIVIGRGKASEFSAAPAATGTATMINTDGRFVERNPMGAWFGLIGFNTPLRYLVAPDVNASSDTFNRFVSNGFGTATVGGTWTVTGTASEYSTTGVVARITMASANVRRYATLAASLTTFDITVRVRTAALATGASLIGGVLFRYAGTADHNRCDLVFNTDQTIQVVFTARVGGVDTSAAAAATGLTHVAGTFYRLRVQSHSVSGQWVRAKVWADNATEPSTWTTWTGIGANTAAGLMGLTAIRTTGNTNTSAIVEFDDWTLVDGPVRRHTGYIDKLPRRWADHSATVLYCPITCSGLTRRLQQGGTIKSAIKAGVLTQSPMPRGYWPVEDKTGSTSIASGLASGLPMTISGPMSLGTGRAAGSDPLAVVTNTQLLNGTVTPYAVTGQWQIMWLINIPAATAGEQALLRWYTRGTYPTWQLVLTPGGGTDTLSLRAYTAGDVESLADPGVTFNGEPYGQQLWFEVTAITSGSGDISWSYELFAGGGLPIQSSGGVKAGALPGTVTGVAFGNGAGADQLAGTTIGHISVWDTAAVTLGGYASIGWGSEPSQDRWMRLGDQEHISTSLRAVSVSDFARMGPPTASTLGAQLDEIELTEVGIAYDDVDGGKTLMLREARYNQPVALTMDVALGQVGWPLEPDNDDQLLVNDVVSSQPSGSSYQFTDTTSPMQVSRRGHYSRPVTSNLYLAGDLRYDAEFRVALGTVDDDRYTAVPLDLTGHPELIAAWMQCDIGSRIQIVNTAALYTFDTIDLIIEGWQEHLSAIDWKVTLYTSSARPWNAFIVQTGTGNQSRVDSGSSTLAAGVSSSATTLSVATSVAADLWVTGSVNFDIGVAGERMTVTNITGSSSPQAFTVTRHVNGVIKAQTTVDGRGQPTKVSLWLPNPIGL